jgi:hypothetical protein
MSGPKDVARRFFARLGVAWDADELGLAAARLIIRHLLAVGDPLAVAVDGSVTLWWLYFDRGVELQPRTVATDRRRQHRSCGPGHMAHPDDRGPATAGYRARPPAAAVTG